MFGPNHSYRYRSRHELELGIHTYRQPTRDFIACRGLCADCRRFLRLWPGWPTRPDAWRWKRGGGGGGAAAGDGTAYPGDLVLPSGEDGHLRHTAARRRANAQFRFARNYDVRQLDVWVLRDWRALPYHECELCALVHAALAPEPEWFEPGRKVQLAMIFRPDGREATAFTVQLISGRDSGSLVYLTLTPKPAGLSSGLNVVIRLADESLRNSSTGSRQSLDRLRRRLNDCCQLEPPSQGDWSPRRLIKVTENTDAHPSVRIVESSTERGHPSYLTLSHRWGKSANLVLTESNVESFKRSIPWTSIPKTYQDALRVTLEMGHNYIWIDSLCVMQDSVADWLSESLCMSKIYGLTRLNLFAGCSRDDQDGMFRRQDHASSPVACVRSEWPGMANRLWYCEISPDSLYRERHLSTTNSSLSSRGWCLQEELLPSRMAYFGPRDVFWTCPHGCASETYPRREHSLEPYQTQDYRLADLVSLKKLLQPTGTTDSEDLRDRIELLWNVVVERFSACKLTFGSDKLIAISGVAQSFRSRLQLLPEDYLAGFWKPWLMRRILWSVSSSVDEDQPRAYDRYVAPSWSWASVQCEVAMSNIYGSDLARLVGSAIGSATGPMGQISAGHIDVCGPLWQIQVEGQVFHPSDIRLSCGHCVPGLPFFGSFDKAVDLNFDRPPRQYLKYFEQHPEYFFLGTELIATGAGVRAFPSVYSMESFTTYGGIQLRGLLLQKDGTQRGEYRRVGRVSVDLEFMLHDGRCTGHELSESFFLERGTDDSVMAKTVRQEIEKYHGGEKLPLLGRVTSADNFEERSDLVWEQYGRLKWPKAYLEPSESSLLRDPVYTIRIV